MEIDICIFLLMLIATIVYACGPQEHPAGAPVTSIPVVPPVLLVTRIPRPSPTAVMMTVSTPAPAPAPTPVMVVAAPAAPAPAPAPLVPPAAVPAPAVPQQVPQPAVPQQVPQPAVPQQVPQPAVPQQVPQPAVPQQAPQPAAPRPPAPVPPAPQPGARVPGGPVAFVFGRRKRSVDLSKMKKCRSAEFDVIMDHKNISQETSEIVEKLESKIESTQKIFNNTMNGIETESIRREKLRVTYKVAAECNSVRHVMLDALVEIETIQSIVIKCECQPSFVMFKKEFKV